jgi:hypothetical protein
MYLVVALLLAAPTNSAGQGPTISQLSPPSVNAGSAGFTLTVTGSNFDGSEVVQWGSTTLPTTDVSSTEVTASVDSSLIVTAGTVSVSVTNDIGPSNSLPFTIYPVVSGISPSSATATAPGFTLTVSGQGFDLAAVAQWNGTTLSTTFGGATQLTAAVPGTLIATPGSATVTVIDNGVTSQSAAPFTINPPPTISSLSPNATAAGGPVFTLTVNGSNFDSAATVQWNGTGIPTSFGSSTQLSATVAASLIASPGTALVTVFDDGVTSNSATFTIAPEPAIGSLSPSSATAGGSDFTLTVSGSGFAAGAVVQWNGTELTTAFVSSSELTATVTASLIATAGSATVTVLEGGVTSNSATFTIAALTITSLSPNTATAGQAGLTLIVNGTGFVSGAVVQWNGAALSTTFVGATQLTAQVSATLIATAGTATVTVVENGVTSGGATFTIAALTITSLSPNTATAGQAGFTLTVNGTGFVSGAAVQWNSTALTTTFVSTTQLTATVTAGLVASAGSATITVTENGATSPGVTFTIAPPPVITSLSPSSATAGQAGFALTVNGSGFVSGATVQWTTTSGTTPLSTTFGSASLLTAQVPASLVASAGSATVTVAENGGTSSGVTFNIAPGPAITSLSPNTAAAGGAAFTLTVNGTGFVSGAVVDWNGTSLSTTFVNSTELTAMVAASLIATPAAASVTVVENGVTSNAANFTVAAEPVITSLDPLAATASGPAFILTVNGTGFLSGAVVHWNSTALTTTFVNSTQLTAQVTANLIATPGTESVTVVEDGVTSAAATFTVSSGPVITSLSPNTATAGGAAFTLTVNGAGFAAGAIVQWNGTALPTTFVNSNQLTAQVAASFIASPGTVTVTVVEGGVTSTSATFTIGPPPVISSLSPNAATAGSGAFTLTVHGSGFISSAVVHWNNSSLPTTFVSATQLTAQVAASLIAAPSTVSVTVGENGVTSGSATFTVALGPVITSLSPGSAAAGGPSFTLTVNGAGFVSGAVVQWNTTSLATTFVSATQLTAQVAANLIATPGSVTVTVVENGTTSPSASFTIAAAPAISSLSPSSAMAGGPAFTLVVNGSGFLSGAVVQWSGSALATSFVSGTQLTAQVPASLIAAPGTATVTVVESGLTSGSATFTISGGPVIASLSPDAATAGSPAFTLTVNGSGFVSGAVVQWNASALATSYVSGTQLTAQVPASLIAAAGTANVTVVENGVTSASATFTIAAGQVITSLSPDAATAGGPAFTLTVNGAGFTSAAVVQWNSTGLTTTFVSGTQLTAAVPASLIAAPGSASITVVMAGTTSTSEPFTITVPSLSLSASPTSSPTQNANVSLTINSAAATQLTGTLAISFVADSSDANTPSGYQDPNLVFVSTGTSTIPFTIAANSKTATLGSNGAIQQGTVAGTITVTMTSLLAGTADVLPIPAPTVTISLPRLAPVIEAGSVTIANLTSAGFDVELNAFSTSRDVQEATFVFTGASGSTLSGSTSFQVSFSSAAANYFGGSTGLKNGGNFGLTVHFTYSGDTSVISGGSVAVTVSNSVGTSSEVTGESQ